MFDIRIGTLIPGELAAAMIPQLNPKGFESYELDFAFMNASSFDFDAYAESLLSVLDGREISALSYYKNPILDETARENLKVLVKNANKLGCSVIGVFAGGIPEKTVPDTIPAFKKTWEPIAALAEEYNIKIGFEGCGRRGWYGGSTNIGYCDEAWELMFDAVPSKAFGLEWEPSHIMERLGDPIMQLRHWADRVVHLHGKDCTIDWDIIKRYGIEGPKDVVCSRLPGFGDTDWTKIFTILLQAGFTGSCDIEGYHDPVHYDDMEWTAQVTSMEYLKRCRGGIEYFAGPTEYRGYQGTRKNRH